MRAVHDLKVWPEPFAALRDGRKRFEVRWERERRYEVGNVLRLREYCPRVCQAQRCEREARHRDSDGLIWCPGHAPLGIHKVGGSRRDCPSFCADLVESCYTGEEVQRRVTYVIRGPAFEASVPEGVVVLSLSETL